MKKIHYFIMVLLGFSVASSCKKASLLHYDHDANIYFDLSQSARDSIVYTFAYDMTKAVDTVYIPVRLMGYQEQNIRYYSAYVEQDSSTALPDVHYKTLDQQYPVLENTGRDNLPIIIYNVPDLEEKSVSLILKLKPSNDFGIENPSLIRTRIVLSAQLEQPSWWSMWLNNYSRVKHQLFLLVTEQRTLTMDGLDAPRNLYFRDMLAIMLNDPFKWIDDNPEKGYILTTTDNGATYSFYHKDNPARIMPLRYNSGAGKYYFIDENGREVR